MARHKLVLSLGEGCRADGRSRPSVAFRFVWMAQHAWRCD